MGSRKLVALVILATFVSVATAGADTAIAWIGEMVPWPMMATGIAMVELELSSDPMAGEIRPGLRSDAVQYGLFALGDGSDPGVSCAVSHHEGEPPVLVVDADNNETLVDDAWLLPARRLDLNTYAWLIDVMVAFEGGDEAHRVPYHLLVTAQYSHETGLFEWFYGGSCHRRGLLTIDGAAYPIAVTNLQTTGGYEDPETLVVAVDVDRDGVLDTLPGSHEVFGPGQDIVLETGSYRIASTRADGMRIEFERVGEASPRPVIKTGLPAPGFEIGSVTGDPIAVPDAQQTTVLVFAGSGRSAGCSTCGLDRFAMPDRVRDLERVLADRAPGAVRIVIITDREVSASDVSAPLSNIPVAVCVAPDVVDLYRRMEELLVIGSDGTIAAMDQFWYTVVEGRPVIHLHRLSPLDVASIVSRLMD